VRICSNTEDRESDVLLMAVLEHANSCNSSGNNESCHDTDKMLQEGRSYAEEQEESGGSTIYSAEKSPGYEAENKCELGTPEPPDNLGNTAKAEYPIQENQAADSVLIVSEMLRHDSVDGESARSCASICQEERLSTKEDQSSAETLSVPHDNNDVGLEACLSLAEPSSVDEHAESSASNFCYEYGDWRVVWDPFYSRYYFYNIQTQESTWYPPEGLEDFASYSSRDATKLVELVSQYTSMEVQENSKNPTICG
jgi:trimethylguanosine synthase